MGADDDVSWDDRVRVLRAVGTGGRPDPADREIVRVLVRRGLLDDRTPDVSLTALGRLVLDDA